MQFGSGWKQPFPNLNGGTRGSYQFGGLLSGRRALDDNIRAFQRHSQSFDKNRKKNNHNDDEASKSLPSKQKDPDTQSKQSKKTTKKQYKGYVFLYDKLILILE